MDRQKPTSHHFVYYIVSTLISNGVRACLGCSEHDERPFVFCRPTPEADCYFLRPSTIC
jgi:hypothetical protein